MKILQLSPQLPFPPTDGGKISIYNTFLNFTELDCDVTLVVLTDCIPKKSDVNTYIPENATYISINHESKNTISKILKYFLSNKSIYIEKHYSDELVEAIEKQVDVNQFDIIHSDHTNMAKIGLKLSNKYSKPIGLRLHNIEYMIWQRYYEELKSYDPRKVFIFQQYKLLKKAEAEFIDKVDIAFTITEVDEKRARQISNEANVKAIPAGVDINLWSKEDSLKKENSLVIATTFNWIHNVNAIKWFLDEVLGNLKSNYDNISLKIIGKNPPEFISKYKTIGAKALGFVDDVKPHLRESEVYIAPLFVGSGIRIKILEAMALGLPVVATDISAEGIKADENDGLFRANNAREYFDIISKLFDDNELRISSGDKARKFIESNHVWFDLISSMKKEYESILALKRNNT